MKKIFAILLVLVIAAAIFAGCNPPPRETDAPSGTKKTGPQTFVPKNMTPEDYVKKYYNLVIDKKLEESYKMQPAENKSKRSKEEYISMHEGMEIKSFKITEVKDEKQAKAVKAKLQLEGFSSGWDVVWTFVKHKDGWIAASSQSAEAK